MHIAITVWAIIASWYWWSRENFHKYHTTILYKSLLNLLYIFLTIGYPLWRIQPDLGFSFPMTSLLYTFIIFPCTTILYLARYPESIKGQILHNIKWMSIYIGVEWIGMLLTRIKYHHGWNFGWSILFVVVMFPMLRLHHKSPLFAYLLSIIIVVLILYGFKVPWNVPFEERLSYGGAITL